MPSIITAGDASNGLVVASGNDGAVVIQSGLAGAKVDALSIAADGQVTSTKPLGKVVQVVNFQTGAVATGTTVIPFDNTIPQITEGNEYMTLAITPTSTASILIVEVTTFLSASTSASHMIVALFQDAVVNALAAMVSFNAGDLQTETQSFTHKMTAGTISAITFRVRAGPHSANTMTFNGSGGVRRFGGVAASSITITEVTP